MSCSLSKDDLMESYRAQDGVLVDRSTGKCKCGKEIYRHFAAAPEAAKKEERGGGGGVRCDDQLVLPAAIVARLRVEAANFRMRVEDMVTHLLDTLRLHAFQRLPLEVVSEILLFLPSKRLALSRAVCRTWNRMVTVHFPFLHAVSHSSGLYFIGGIQLQNDVSLYAPSAVFRKSHRKDGWIHLPPHWTQRVWHVGAAVYDRKIFVFGGRNSDERLRTCAFFDVATQLWNELPPMRQQRSACTATTIGGKIYVCGGYNGAAVFSSVEVFDPRTLMWEDETSCPDMPTPLCEHSALMYNEWLFTVGGTKDRDGPVEGFTRSVFAFSHRRNEWMSLAPMPRAVLRPAVGVVEFSGVPTLIVIGGQSQDEVGNPRNIRGMMALTLTNGDGQWGTKWSCVSRVLSDDLVNSDSFVLPDQPNTFYFISSNLERTRLKSVVVKEGKLLFQDAPFPDPPFRDAARIVALD